MRETIVRGKQVVLGLSIPAFTILHVVISLIGIVTGLVWLAAYLRGRWLGTINTIFLITTILTTLTGFLFPLNGITPAVAVGFVSSAILAVAVLALLLGRKGLWRPVYAMTAIIGLYLNCFVLVVQSFLKIPFAPNGSEPPFAIVQGLVLIGFAISGWRALHR